MSRWTDLADWIGPTKNMTPAGMSNVVGVVLHIQDGNEQGTEAWQRNTSAQVSSHFLSPKVGHGRQMVDTADKAWAEVAGNSHWLSIENEGYSGQSLTANQVEFCAQILARANLVYGVPLQATSDPGVPGLGHHSMGGDAWGGHFSCPGNPILNQKPDIIRRAIEIRFGQIMADLDYTGAWKMQPMIQNRPARVELDDLWGQELNEASPWGGGQSARTQRLVRIESKIDALAGQVKDLAGAVAKLVPSK